MFTGLIEEVGSVLRVEKRAQGAHLYIGAQKVTQGTRLGDSIAVDGACLTVVHAAASQFAVDCMAETLATTTLGELRPGAAVNLERAMALGDRLGGHLVLGHVDGVGEVVSVREQGIARHLRVAFPVELGAYLAPKGSVAIHGISLTVIEVEGSEFGVGVIPHTLKETTLRDVRVGRRVNLEADVLARYVRQALLGGGRHRSAHPGGMSFEALREAGLLD
ncbi:MAG: riboflavin synthase [Actinobacteria bacterium]|nr:riboflavin synthase [Actinomycetota bacterium]